MIDILLFGFIDSYSFRSTLSVYIFLCVCSVGHTYFQKIWILFCSVNLKICNCLKIISVAKKYFLPCKMRGLFSIYGETNSRVLFVRGKFCHCIHGITKSSYMLWVLRPMLSWFYVRFTGKQEVWNAIRVIEANAFSLLLAI